MRAYSNDSDFTSYARNSPRGHRRTQRRPAALSLCAAAGAAVFLACLYAEITPLWALATAGFCTILITLGLTFLWAVISGIERMRE